MAMACSISIMDDHQSQFHHTHGGCNHHHMPARYDWIFGIGIALNVVFVIAEVIAGLYSNSIALLSDAGHNASDVLGLVIAWIAVWMARKSPQGRFTYGLGKGSVLASIINAFLILVAVGIIIWEAISRIGADITISGYIVVITAGVGIIINTATALLFMRDKDKDLNMKGAYLHMAADALVSLGVVVTGALILYTGWNWVDPIVSLLIAVVIIWSVWGLLIESINLVLDGVPTHIDQDAVHKYLSSLPNVIAVHDMHIWALSTTEVSLTAHIEVPDCNKACPLIKEINKDLAEKFAITHATVQFETSGSCAGKCISNNQES